MTLQLFGWTLSTDQLQMAQIQDLAEIYLTKLKILLFQVRQVIFRILKDGLTNTYICSNELYIYISNKTCIYISYN